MVPTSPFFVKDSLSTLTSYTLLKERTEISRAPLRSILLFCSRTRNLSVVADDIDSLGGASSAKSSVSINVALLISPFLVLESGEADQDVSALFVDLSSGPGR